MLKSTFLKMIIYLILIPGFELLISLKYNFTKNYEYNEKLMFVWYDILIFIVSDLSVFIPIFYNPIKKFINCLMKCTDDKDNSLELKSINENPWESLLPKRRRLIYFCLLMAVIETIVKFSDILLLKNVKNGVVKEYGMSFYISFDFFFRLIYFLFIDDKEVNVIQQSCCSVMIIFSILLNVFYGMSLSGDISFIQYIFIAVKSILIPLEDSIYHKIPKKMYVEIRLIMFCRGFFSSVFFIFISIYMFSVYNIVFIGLFSFKFIGISIILVIFNIGRTYTLLRFIDTFNYVYLTFFKLPLLIRNYYIFIEFYDYIYLDLFYTLFFIISLFFFLVFLEIIQLNFCGLSEFNFQKIDERGQVNTQQNREGKIDELNADVVKVETDENSDGGPEDLISSF